MFRAVEAIFRFPFSILHLNDGDGLENSVDPEPLVAGPDAHGTNSEWYNVVCSNVFSEVEGPNGIALAPRSGEVNTNAYNFVDVIADRGPTPIHFIADGESRLGNPVLIAQAGETNRVPLLIGATYSVTSDVPLRVFAPIAAVVEAQAAVGRFRIVCHSPPSNDAWISTLRSPTSELEIR